MANQMDSVHMVLMGPETRRIQHIGRSLLSVKEQLYYNLKPFPVKGLYHVLKFPDRLFPAAAGVSAFGRK